MSESCARGCVVARKHADGCTCTTECRKHEGHCKGCLPRDAEFGLLCFGCHQRLLNMLHTAPAQHSLLLAVVEPSSSQALTAETQVTYPGPRTASDAPTYMQPAHRAAAAAASEPIRLAAVDTAQQLADILSEWVEMLVTHHSMAGPDRLQTQAQRMEGSFGRWRWWEYGGEYVWTEPPARFAIGSASRWLLAQIERLEYCPGIGDLWTNLAEVMSQAHALAPWREQAATLAGIECPCCHRMTLRLFGGDDFVTCTTCRETVEWARYAIWVRELAQRRETA